MKDMLNLIIEENKGIKKTIDSMGKSLEFMNGKFEKICWKILK